MIDQLDKFGLPVKYAIVGFFAGVPPTTARRGPRPFPWAFR